MRATAPTGHRCRGAVLAEAVMVILVGGLIVSVLPGFYFTYVRLWQRETGKLGAMQRADFAVQRMKKDIRNARSVVVSSDGTGLTLVMPRLGYDAAFGVRAPVLDAAGRIADGDRVHYYWIRDPDNTESRGGGIYRRVVLDGGYEETPRIVADKIYPQLNPRAAGGSTPLPLFAYDPSTNLVTVSLTAIEPNPSAGTFSPAELEPKCARDGGDLVRVATSEHPEGEVQCSKCGSMVRPSAHVVSYRARLEPRNG